MTKIRLHPGARSGGLHVHVFNADEHPPAHVHVVKGSNPRTGPYCRIKLGGPGDVGDPRQGPFLWDVYGMSKEEARRAMELVSQHLDDCWATWRRLHGDRI